MQVFFYLSGEHPTLPKAEALASLEALELSYKVFDYFEQVLAVEMSDIGKLPARLAMCHAICKLGGISEASYDKAVALSNLVKVKGSFAVRVKRIKHYHEEIRTARLENLIGKAIKERGYVVELERPDEVVLGILSEKFALGKVMSEVDRSQYEARRPPKRPYFKPGAMLPRNCRAIVNLTRVKEGDNFVDPFCGTGGFLIEAGLLGAKIYGYDTDSEAIEGCEENLKHSGLKGFNLKKMDARDLGKKHPKMFDALAADLPYGISSSTRGLSLDELCAQSLESFHGALKNGRYACVVATSEVDVVGLSKDYGFIPVEEHLERVHGSLTRRITVLKKP